MKNKIFSMLLIFFIVFASGLPLSASTTDPIFNLEFDKESYQPGESMTVTVTVLVDGEPKKVPFLTLVVKPLTELTYQWGAADFNESTGSYSLTRVIPEYAETDTYQAVVSALGDDDTFDLTIDSDSTTNPVTPITELNFDDLGGPYYPSEDKDISISGEVLKDGTALSDVDVSIYVTKGENVLRFDQVKTDSNGLFNAIYSLTENAESGTYTVKAKVDGMEEETSSTFEVKIKSTPSPQPSPIVTPTPPPSPSNDDVTASVDLPTEDVTTWEEQQNVTPTKEWEVQFNVAMDSATLNGENIFIIDENGNKIETTINIMNDGKGIKVSPTEALANQSRYTLWITTGVMFKETPLSKNIKLVFVTN